MCLAAAAPFLQFAISAASAVVGFQAEAQQAAAQNELYEANQIAAINSANERYQANAIKAAQEKQAASLEKENAQRDAREARATAEVAAGEAGVSGLSVDALVNSYYQKQSRFEQSLDTNYQMTASYLEAEGKADRANAISRINSVQKAQPPSFAGAALRIAGAGLDAFARS